MITKVRFISCSKIIFKLLIIIFIIHEINAHRKKSLTEDDEDEKRVFNRNFGNKKNFAIDDCIPLAFGDFNADKIVDIFCRNMKGDNIRVMLNNDRSPTQKEQCNVNITGIIYDALAADYDGDSKLDLFILYKATPDQDVYNGGFLWGDRVKLSELQPINYFFQTIPTTLDANGDSYVDLLGMISNDYVNYRPACLMFKNRTVYNFEKLNNVDDLLPDSTQATVDLNNDLIADLFLTVNHNNKPRFRVYQLPLTNMKLISDYGPPPGVAIYHLSIFADIDADGVLEHILPVCMNNDCSDSQIFVRDNHKWYSLQTNFGGDVRFPLKHEIPAPFNQIPISIKIADYNLDGYPDMVAVMKQNSINSTVSIILKNRPCNSDNNLFCNYNRTFAVQTDEVFVLSASNATLAAFFDVLENGYPDLLVLQKTPNEDFQLIGFQNSLIQDVHFIKVMVLSTFSCDTCSHRQRLPYGNNQPGQSIKMETITTADGIKDSWIQLAAVQMSQSGQLTLELPYVIIGLGATPNFVEKLTIAIPPTNQSNHLFHTYTQMIPNSQIVVLPSPLMNPEKWHSELFVTPSRMIIHTGIALSATLVVIVFVLAILQYRDKINRKTLHRLLTLWQADQHTVTIVSETPTSENNYDRQSSRNSRNSNSTHTSHLMSQRQLSDSCTPTTCFILFENGSSINSNGIGFLEYRGTRSRNHHSKKLYLPQVLYDYQASLDEMYGEFANCIRQVLNSISHDLSSYVISIRTGVLYYYSKRFRFDNNYSIEEIHSITEKKIPLTNTHYYYNARNSSYPSDDTLRSSFCNIKPISRPNEFVKELENCDFHIQQCKHVFRIYLQSDDKQTHVCIVDPAANYAIVEFSKDFQRLSNIDFIRNRDSSKYKQTKTYDDIFDFRIQFQYDPRTHSDQMKTIEYELRQQFPLLDENFQNENILRPITDNMNDDQFYISEQLFPYIKFIRRDFGDVYHYAGDNKLWENFIIYLESPVEYRIDRNELTCTRELATHGIVYARLDLNKMMSSNTIDENLLIEKLWDMGFGLTHIAGKCTTSETQQSTNYYTTNGGKYTAEDEALVQTILKQLNLPSMLGLRNSASNNEIKQTYERIKTQLDGRWHHIRSGNMAQEKLDAFYYQYFNGEN
ncbi:unnamed protein product [Adineta steineri]|uniref:T-cell immunomodulatory protein TIP C2 domain-containing protein n=1 Tax=Adineta steineri TaxID=433720 RepID=A0A813NPJ0_9BILA|nr:unnamed protein product [Adineta steineri]CAF0769758.1 unnamed protein product [Adineta steineri]